MNPLNELWDAFRYTGSVDAYMEYKSEIDFMRQGWM
jgi:hypothetical protein